MAYLDNCLFGVGVGALLVTQYVINGASSKTNSYTSRPVAKVVIFTPIGLTTDDLYRKVLFRWCVSS